MMSQHRCSILWAKMKRTHQHYLLYGIISFSHLLTYTAKVLSVSSHARVKKEWFMLPCLTLHSVSIGLMKGEPRMVCVLIMWSSRSTWMSSTADTILVPYDGTSNIFKTSSCQCYVWKSMGCNITNMLIHCNISVFKMWCLGRRWAF